MTDSPILPAFFRLEMPVGPFAETFAQDRDHFIKTKLRTAIRWAKPDELEPDIPAHPGKLPLWAVVAQAMPGLHIVLPIWRGYRPTPLAGRDYIPIKFDNEIGKIVQHCVDRGGYSADEWANSVEQRSRGWNIP